MYCSIASLYHLYKWMERTHNICTKSQNLSIKHAFSIQPPTYLPISFSLYIYIYTELLQILLSSLPCFLTFCCSAFPTCFTLVLNDGAEVGPLRIIMYFVFRCSCVGEVSRMVAALNQEE